MTSAGDVVAAEAEALAADAEHEGGRRGPTLDVGVNLQHGLGCEGVGADRTGCCRAGLAEVEGGRSACSGVDEEGQLVALEIEGVFDLQLEIAHQMDTRPGLLLEPGHQQRPEGIVAP